MTTLDKPRVLIADNDPRRVRRFRRLLTENGFSVVAAVTTGEEALTGSQWLRPDLIMLGLNLDGEMDGAAAAEAISLTTSTPLVILDDPGIERLALRDVSEVAAFLGRTADDNSILSLASRLSHRSICSLEGSEWGCEQMAV